MISKNINLTELVTEETEDSETFEISVDYTPYFNQVIENQAREITLLEQQNVILLEQVNGFSIIANYLNGFFIISLVVIGVTFLWNVLNKWFFRGV